MKGEPASRPRPRPVVPGRGWLLVALFLFLIGCLSPLHGQGQYSFRSWQSEDGLPVNNVRSIVQSTEGHLWIATAECVASFDGVEFERVPQHPGFPYPHSGDNRLFATAGEIVWFSSARGGLLQITDGVPSIIWPDGPAGSPPVTQVMDHPGGGVVARRGAEVWIIRPDGVTRVEKPDDDILKMLGDDLTTRASKGRIGIDGTPGRLVDRGASVWSVSADGALTVTSPEGVRRSMTMKRVSQDSHVTELLEDREGNIWVATALNGLGLFREDRVEVVNAAAGLSEGAVLAVIEDSRGKVWLGNRRGGVDRIIDGK
ncbi:MAG: hypothetical protein EOP85_15970, partial [Verrucomicrobiaceae bacterium]